MGQMFIAMLHGAETKSFIAAARAASRGMPALFFFPQH
jgi:hypothetical protein